MKVGDLIRWKRTTKMSSDIWERVSRRHGIIMEAPASPTGVKDVFVYWPQAKQSGWIYAAHLEIYK